MITPPALDKGTILSNRFEVEEVLGRGGFAIAYRAHDHVRQDRATVKELAPAGSTRDATGLLNLNDANPHRLRDRFLDEARTLARLDLPGVLPVRATFVENGTAYFVTDYVPDSRTLQDAIDREGPLPPDGALDVFFQILETLEALHAKHLLHRDIKPSNILLAPDGHVILIDFGAAREWLADISQRQTILFTPGYAPLEQLAERASRGPATDLYALCATMYHLLTGRVPTPAADRASGVPLIPLQQLRPGLEPAVTRAIEAGLALRFGERPQSAAELRAKLVAAEMDAGALTLRQYDLELVRLRKFRYEKRQCPGCGEPIEEPRPLRKGACPVCREGIVKTRDLSERQCPVCRMGAMHKRENVGPLTACPKCKLGRLGSHRKSLLKRTVVFTCSACHASYESSEGGMYPLGKPEEDRSFAEWRAESGRSTEIWQCDSCEAQFDLMPDGRRRLMTKAKGVEYASLYPEEWARVAVGLDPGAGNAFCNGCEADFFLDGKTLTLLDAREDIHGFGEHHLGRLIDLEDVRWLAVGKESPHPGLSCPHCDTEFDKDGDFFRLIRSHNPALARFDGEPFTFEDWHRIAQRLPTAGDEQAFVEGIQDAIARAYRQGEIGFDSENEVLWRGPATRLEDGAEATLTITRSEIAFGGLLRKSRRPMDALTGAGASQDQLALTFRGVAKQDEYVLEPIELSVSLESGEKSAVINAEDLAARLTH